MSVLRVLLIEDSESDAALIVRLLERIGYEVQWRRVEEAGEMREELLRQPWDAIISDHRMGSFDAPGALRVLHETGLDLPFLVVSGAIGEDLAVALMKSGAHDYILKGNLKRLGPAVEREIREAQVRRQHRESAAALRISEERLSLAMAAAQLGIFDFDPRSRRLQSFAATNRPLGLAASTDVSYDAFLREIHPEDRERVDGMVEAALRGERGGEFAAEFRTVAIEDGLERWLSASGRALFESAGKPKRFIGTTLDVTERRRLEERLREAQELESMEIRRLNNDLLKRANDLADANKELDAFCYSISHDLRAPLRHLDGFLKLLGNHIGGGLDEKGRHFFNKVQKSACHMGQLIDALLGFSRMGRAGLRRTRVGMAELITEVREELAADLRDRNVCWVVEALPEVTGDPVLLKQVLINLVGNALKFTRARTEAVIEIGSREQDSEWVFFVRDNGVGFDARYADRLFDVFQRFHPADQSGTGIGLAIVKRIVCRHGGRAWAESVVGQGASFYFSLPKAGGQDKADTGAGGREPGTALTEHKLWV